MPYKNIQFIKLFLDLFDSDDRFLYQLNESQQLLYIKLLYLAGRTDNKIPKNIRFLCHKINYSHDNSSFLADISRVMAVFPQFIESANFYYFNNFKKLHNFIDKGVPKEFPRMLLDKDKEEDKEKELADTNPPIKAVLKSVPPNFDPIWELYPKKLGKKDAQRHFYASLKNGRQVGEITRSIKNYIQFIKDNKTEPQYVLHGSTFFNNWEDYLNYESSSKPRSRTDSQPTIRSVKDFNTAS